MEPPLIRRFADPQAYEPVWESMQEFTRHRDEQTQDEIWLLQHEPVFTLGQAGKPEHILSNTDIAIVNSDRGGQVTYHGPGQLIMYTLLDIKRLGLGVRDLVTALETSLINLLQAYAVEGYAKKEAPGVYVQIDHKEHKVGALGLRVKQGRAYHGLSLNIDMDLSPFSLINPCGYEGLAVTQLKDLIPDLPDIQVIEDQLVKIFLEQVNHG